MADIKVNSATMREKKSRFENIAKDIKTYIDDMDNEIKSLNSWQGSAKDEYKKQFENLKPKFDGIIKSIKDYATFLESAAVEYDKVETANKTSK